MNYCGLDLCDSSNGDGICVSLYVSGCTMHCKGCQNPESWDFDYGLPFTDEVKKKIIDAIGEKYIDGFCVLGGDPLEQPNIDTVKSLCKEIKDKYPNKKIWLWSGRKQQKVIDSGITDYVDIIVSEPYIEKKHVNARYYGSSNQKVWWAKTKQQYDVDKDDEM